MEGDADPAHQGEAVEAAKAADEVAAEAAAVEPPSSPQRDGGSLRAGNKSAREEAAALADAALEEQARAMVDAAIDELEHSPRREGRVGLRSGAHLSPRSQAGKHIGTFGAGASWTKW